MKIKELIEILQKHPNQNAKIEIIANPSINAENDLMDIKLNEIEVFHEDGFYNDFVELLIFNADECYQINN
jgi:hypothetical protein